MSNLNKESFGHSVLGLIDKYPQFFIFVGVVFVITTVGLMSHSCSRNKEI